MAVHGVDARHGRRAARTASRISTSPPAAECPPSPGGNSAHTSLRTAPSPAPTTAAPARRRLSVGGGATPVQHLTQLEWRHTPGQTPGPASALPDDQRRGESRSRVAHCRPSASPLRPAPSAFAAPSMPRSQSSAPCRPHRAKLRAFQPTLADRAQGLAFKVDDDEILAPSRAPARGDSRRARAMRGALQSDARRELAEHAGAHRLSRFEQRPEPCRLLRTAERADPAA